MTDNNPIIGKTGERLHDHSYYQLMQCVGTCGRLFIVKLERKEDLSMSHTSDIGEAIGYAIYRDSVLVKCPDCKGLSVIKFGSIDIEIRKVK